MTFRQARQFLEIHFSRHRVPWQLAQGVDPRRRKEATRTGGFCRSYRVFGLESFSNQREFMWCTEIYPYPAFFPFTNLFSRAFPEKLLKRVPPTRHPLPRRPAEHRRPRGHQLPQLPQGFGHARGVGDPQSYEGLGVAEGFLVAFLFLGGRWVGRF